jgi:lipid II:glycine glycyltransferase (peptidoglycan interpeptide bridge formation enzyme)
MKTFLQTIDWLKFQEFIGRKTWRFDNGKVVANIIRHELKFGKNYLYIPHGPEIFFDNIQGGVKNEINVFMTYLKDLARENKSIFIKMEPLSDTVVENIFKHKGVLKSKKQVQPQKTIIIDLGYSEEQIISKMHHKTRYNIRVAERHKIIVKQSNDLEIFYDLLDKTSKRDKFHSHSKEYYYKLLEYFNNQEGKLKTNLFLAYFKEKPVACAIIMQYEDMAYYLHGASDYNFRSLMAPYALHWNIIVDLKSRGVNFYDLWGIDSEKWPGITRFKLGWGGKVKEYPGSFDFVFSGFWYVMYNFARKFF